MGLNRLKSEPSIFESPFKQALEIVGRAALHARRYLLGKNFKQHLRHGSAPHHRGCKPLLATGPSQCPHAPDVGRSLGHANNAASIKQVEEV